VRRCRPCRSSTGRGYRESDCPKPGENGVPARLCNHQKKRAAGRLTGGPQFQSPAIRTGRSSIRDRSGSRHRCGTASCRH
jgi:hypothetical protein